MSRPLCIQQGCQYYRGFIGKSRVQTPLYTARVSKTAVLRALPAALQGSVAGAIFQGGATAVRKLQLPQICVLMPFQGSESFRALEAKFLEVRQLPENCSEID